jgi:tRNA A37 threonylcarbamoyltransferase TsaD
MIIEIKNRNLNICLSVPPPSLCTDNAAYIASFANFNFKPLPWHDIQAKPDLEVEV